MRLAAILVAIATAAGAQTVSTSSGTISGHNGWSFADTIQSATDVVVADVLSGTGVDDGSEVSARATLRVVRVLSGGLAAGAEIAAQWKYKPLLTQGPAVTSKVPQERGLWFLLRTDGGSYGALQAGMGPGEAGGVYLPAGPAPRYYAADAPVSYKIACEIAPLLEEVAAQHSADLVVANPMPVLSPASPAVRNRIRFYTLHIALQSLDAKATKDVYAEFSARPEPYVKAIGIAGRLQHGDASALVDLEANLPALAPVLQNGGIPMFAGGMELRDNPPAARALARMAIGETAVASIESNAPMQLAFTRSPEFLPYLVVMLGSPSPMTRGLALMAFCPLLRESALWKPEMTGHCPNRAGSAPEPNEQADVRYWRAWWETTREQISKTTPLPDVHPPARYSIPQNTGFVTMEVPPEIRFLSLLHMSRTMSDHYHAGDGTMVAGAPPPPHDPVSGKLGEADRAAYGELTMNVNAKLDALDKKAEQVMNAARLAGKMPDRPQLVALNDERTAVLKTGLEQLRSRLSPEGWTVIEKFFSESGGAMMMAAPPGPPK
jgi:hypothetical protein